MHRANLTIALAAVLLATAGGHAAAQTPPAPRETFPTIGVNGYASSHVGDQEPMRRAAPVGDLTSWLPENDPAVVLARSDPKATGFASLELTVDTTGRLTDCKVKYAYGDDQRSQALCDRVRARARMTPAIDETGAPVADRYLFNVSFMRGWAPQSPLVVIRQPAPAPPPPGGRWPPFSASLDVGITKLDLLAGGPESADARAEPWAGVVYSPENQNNPCRVEKSSGDAKFDARACAAARKGRYDLSRETTPYRRRADLHFVLSGGKPRALVPVQAQASRPTATEAGTAAIRSALAALPADGARRLRLGVTVAPSGAVTHCGIEASTGTDAGDVAACAAVRGAAPFVAARDVFGRPFASYLYDWNPLPRPAEAAR